MARDEQGGLAGLPPLDEAHNLLEAWALVEAVEPKRLHLYRLLQLRPRPVRRSSARRARSAAAGPGLSVESAGVSG